MNGLSAYRPGVLSQQLRAPWCRRIRKPMLYPLSYEGLRCPFAQHVGLVLVRRVRAGCLAPDGLCRTCAAGRELADPPPSRRAAPIIRRVVPSQESEAGRATR
jgi:hypothetical protein